MLSKLSVQHRVFAAFAALIVLMGCLLVLALSGIASISGALATYEVASGNATRVAQVADALSQARLALVRYDGTLGETEKAQLENQYLAFQSAHGSLAATAELGALADGLDDAVLGYGATVGALLELDAQSVALQTQMDSEGLAATQTLAALIEKSSQSANLNAKAAALSGLAMQNILTMRLDVTGLVDGAATLAAIQAAADASQVALDSLRGTFFKTEDVAAVDAVKAAVDRYAGAVSAAADLIEQRRETAAVLSAVDAELSGAYAGMVDAIIAAQNQAGAASQARAGWTQIATMVVGGIALLLGALLALLMARWLTGFIGRTASAMDALLAGRFDVEFGTSTAQEFHRMTLALERFRGNGQAMARMDREAATTRQIEAQASARRDRLQTSLIGVVEAAAEGDFSCRLTADFDDGALNETAELVNRLMDMLEDGLAEAGGVLAALAAADLTRRVTGDYRGAFARLKTDTNAVADKLGEVVRQLRQTSGALKSATGEILSGANDLSERTNKQAATIEQTSAAMEQLASTVLNNAQRAREASAKASTVTRTAEEGGEVMARATDAMERITQSSSKISNIIGLIDDIAFQTNLLALNASVEAARAGEAGKGFAVVAVEVRRLAQSAAQASSEVKVLIEQSAGEVTTGTKLVSDAAGKLASMVGAIRDNTLDLETIARDSSDQATAIDEVTVAVRVLDEMTQHNAALVEQTNAAIEQTEAQASELDRIVDVFTIAEIGVAGAAKAAVPRLLLQGNAALAADWDAY